MYVYIYIYISLSPVFVPASREGMHGHVRPEHAAVRRPVAAGDRGDVRRPLVLPQGLQRRVADAAGRLPHVPGLRLPLRPHAQVTVGLATETRCQYGTGSNTTGITRIETQRTFRCFFPVPESIEIEKNYCCELLR